MGRSGGRRLATVRCRRAEGFLYCGGVKYTAGYLAGECEPPPSPMLARVLGTARTGRNVSALVSVGVPMGSHAPGYSISSGAAAQERAQLPGGAATPAHPYSNSFARIGCMATSPPLPACP